MPREAQCFVVRHPQPELFHYLYSDVSPFLVVICLLIHHHEYIYMFSYLSDFQTKYAAMGAGFVMELVSRITVPLRANVLPSTGRAGGQSDGCERENISCEKSCLYRESQSCRPPNRRWPPLRCAHDNLATGGRNKCGNGLENPDVSCVARQSGGSCYHKTYHPRSCRHQAPGLSLPVPWPRSPVFVRRRRYTRWSSLF